jgi:hypothetical protein
MENSAHRIFEIKSKDDPEGNVRRTAIPGGMKAANSKGNSENSQIQPAAQTISPSSNYRNANQLQQS